MSTINYQFDDFVRIRDMVLSFSMPDKADFWLKFNSRTFRKLRRDQRSDKSASKELFLVNDMN